jgi:hypothetical protein
MTENLLQSGNGSKAIGGNAGEIAGIPDPFDVAKLRLDPSSIVETAGVKKLRRTVPVRRPSPQDFVRVNANPAYRVKFGVIELKDDREDYLVVPHLVPQLPGEVVFKTIFTAINRQGVVFLWPVRLPGLEDKPNAWWHSALEAAELAMTEWVRIKANMSLGAYEMFTAASEVPDPDWSELESFQDLLRIAFRGRLIDNLDHAVIKRLRG